MGVASKMSGESKKYRPQAGLDPALLTVEQQVIATVSPHSSLQEINNILAGDLNKHDSVEILRVDRSVETDPLLCFPAPDSSQSQNSHSLCNDPPSYCNSPRYKEEEDELVIGNSPSPAIQQPTYCGLCSWFGKKTMD